MATSVIKSMILQLVLYTITNQQPLLCPSTAMWQCSPTPSMIIAAPNNFNLDVQTPPPQTVPQPNAPTITPLPLKPKPTVTPEKPATPSLKTSPLQLTQEADQIAAARAWKYFERNWNPQTGLVNSADNFPWTTWWDQGSALLGIHAARQLGLLPPDMFQKRMNTLLQTLEKLPLPATGLPNKAYSTRTAEMRQLNDTPDRKGITGWSAIDMARFLLALHVLRSHYPEYSDSPKGDSFASRINHIVTRWHLSKLVKDGWLNGAIARAGKLLEVQEGRYENSQLGVNVSVDVNTNAIVLESLLYKARGRHPMSINFIFGTIAFPNHIRYIIAPSSHALRGLGVGFLYVTQARTAIIPI